MRKIPLAGLLLALAATQGAAAAPAPDAAVERAAGIVSMAIKDGKIPGAQMAVSADGKIIADRAMGFAQLNDFDMHPLANPRPMRTTTLFDCASVTKVMATTFAVMLLVDAGKIDVDAPVFTYLPDFRGPELDKITVRHLLTHTAGLVQWQPIYYHAANKAEAYKVIREMPLQWPVGEGYHYSDLSFMLLGYIVEQVSGHALDRYIGERLYTPLGLKHTTFLPLRHGFTDFAATEAGNGYEHHMVYGPNFGYGYKGDPASWNGWRQYVLAGEADDGNSWYAHGGVAGHAGLFSTANDLRVLLELLLGHGVYQGRSYFSERVVELFLQPGAHLGWIEPEGFPRGSFAHTGFTGTYVLGVPAAKLAVVLLTNRQNVGADAAGYFTDVLPIQNAAAHAILDPRLTK